MTNTHNVVQFATLADFIADLAAGHVAAIYHDLHEQRLAASPQYGLSTWLLTTVVRAIVANGYITHIATLTIPHGRVVERVHGELFHPPDQANETARWNHARDEHADIIDHLLDQLAPYGLINLVRAGVLNVPDGTPLCLAANPLRELAESAEALRREFADDDLRATDYHPGGDGSSD